MKTNIGTKNRTFPFRHSVVAMGVALLTFAGRAEATILKSWTFEDDNPLHGFDFSRKDQYRPEVVADPKNPANKVMCVTHTSSSPRPERAELAGEAGINVGDERWVSARILIVDPLQPKWTCYFQIGPIWGAPGKGRAGLYQLDAFATPVWKMRGWMGRAGRPDFTKNLRTLKIGEWTTWVFHIKLRADKSGIFEAWNDGVKVLTDVGQNAWKGDQIHVQWGIYHGKTDVPIRAYYDDIMIGDAHSSYEEVCPKSK